MLVTHVFPWTPQPLTTTGKSLFNFCNTCSHLRSTSSALINNGTGLIWNKLSLYGQLGWGSIRSLSIILLRFFSPIYLVGNHFTCVGLFLHLLGTRNQSECGKQKSWWFINISGPINNAFNFIQKGIGNFAQFGALEWSQSRSAKAKPRVGDGARCSRCPSLPPSPSYNATPPATEGCRATRVSRDLFASPAHLVWQRALPVWQDRGSMQFWPLSGTLGQSFCPSALTLLTDGTEHWESKKSVFTGNPSFPQGWLVCCWFIFYLKDNKTLSRKIDFIFRKDKGSSKSGITDSKTFRRIWKLISLQECYSFQLFIYSFWFFSLQDYCSFIFA